MVAGLGAGCYEDYIDIVMWRQSAMIEIINKINKEN